MRTDDYYPVTIDVNGSPEVNDLVSRCAERFEKLNGHRVRIIGNNDIAQSYKARNLTHPKFIKTLLWDLVPESVDTILYYDRDVVPVRPVGELPQGAFSAVPTRAVALKRAKETWPLFERTGLYFNSGVIVARREAKPVFDAVYSLASRKQDALNLLDQSLFNLMAQHFFNVTVLPKEWNYCVTIEEDIVPEPKMVHCCGTRKPYTLAAYILAEAERTLP